MTEKNRVWVNVDHGGSWTLGGGYVCAIPDIVGYYPSVTDAVNSLRNMLRIVNGILAKYATGDVSFSLDVAENSLLDKRFYTLKEIHGTNWTMDICNVLLALDPSPPNRRATRIEFDMSAVVRSMVEWAPGLYVVYDDHHYDAWYSVYAADNRKGWWTFDGSDWGLRIDLPDGPYQLVVDQEEKDNGG